MCGRKSRDRRRPDPTSPQTRLVRQWRRTSCQYTTGSDGLTVPPQVGVDRPSGTQLFHSRQTPVHRTLGVLSCQSELPKRLVQLLRTAACVPSRLESRKLRFDTGEVNAVAAQIGSAVCRVFDTRARHYLPDDLREVADLVVLL